jgi:nucleotide-binding universal stress UspA family protein
MTARIVVGVDGSEHARRALEWAVEEAGRRDATIDAVHAYRSLPYFPGMEFGYVAPPPKEKLEAEALQRLLEVIEGLHTDVPVDPIVIDDSAARALIDTARGAELLVVGSRGFGGFKGLLLGSTSLQVVTHAPCPVVVVPAPSPQTEA